MKILNTRILKKSVITLSFLCYLITCGFVPYYYDEATNLCYGDGLFNLFFGWFCFVFPGIFTKIYSSEKIVKHAKEYNLVNIPGNKKQKQPQNKLKNKKPKKRLFTLS